MTDGTKKREELSTEKQALLALRKMRAKLEELEKARTEPIAIVGLGCRFPGGASDGETFWRLLEAGVDAITKVPPGRWDLESFFDPDPEAPGKIATPYGGFVADVDKLDAAFFGISPREAAPLDPQQRLALEVSWEALENAGLAPDRLAGTETGVYFGVSTNDYAHVQIANGDPARVDAYFGTGVAIASIAGRISYVLGLSGPSLVVDTACSSSLVSVHLAAASLRARECDLALAGGVNVLLSPEVSVAFSRAQMMAKDGRCKTFDASADGYVRGEGCGVIVLERLGDALRAGHRVLALLRGSAVNQDGRSSGFTAPNELAQQVVIRRALRSAGIAGRAVDYVEAHGTGTKLGDPIELQALAAVLGEGRGKSEPLVVGSVKTNVGHLEAAAGIAGLIKVVLALQKERIPPHLHFRVPNPHVAWEEMPIAIPAEGRDWPRSGRSRIAGVSSFGFTGTNAHVILEEAPEIEASAEADGVPHVLLLSGKTETALGALATRLTEHLRASEDDFADICHTADVGRARFSHRLAVVARSNEEAASKLEAFVSGERRDGVVAHRVSAPPKIAFLFTGQGSQYEGMGRELFETEPVFREMLERCDHLLRKHVDLPLLSVLYPERGGSGETPLDETAHTQPALFALQVALTELWRSRGVEPAYVMGHSVGEYAAAWAAGVFDLERGLELVALRGALMQSLPPGGGMAAVFCDESRLRSLLYEREGENGDVEVAAFNGPDNVVLTGPRASLARALEWLASHGVKWRELDVLRAFHSRAMDPILARFEAEVSRTALARPRLGLVSNLTGDLADKELLSASYWSAQLREPVRFQRGIETLVRKGCDVFVEIGPGTTLSAMGLECAPEVLFVSSLRKTERVASLAEGLASLAVRGVDVHETPTEAVKRRRVSLPTYPFERETFWIERTPRPSARTVAPEPREEGWLYEVTWEETTPFTGAAGSLPGAAEVVRALDAVSGEIGAREGIELYDELLPAMHGLAADFVVDAFVELGFAPAPGARFSTAGSACGLGIVERHRRLWGRLLEILAEEELVEHVAETDEWRLAKKLDLRGALSRCRSLRRELPRGDVELSLLEACGERLASVLRGECDPLEILFPEGGLSRIEGLYRDTVAARTFNGLVRSAVASALDSLPEDAPLRVLELGAGTGGTTASVLPLFSPSSTTYVFSDVSPLFLSRAREAFRDVPFVSFATLDLEREPTEQGFRRESFDLVLAANVLHATSDLRASLRRAASLLAPGGVLLLFEVVEHERFSDLTVGLTDGWWKFSDPELRTGGPLLSRSQWMTLLAEEGFSDVAVFPKSTDRGIWGKQALLWARRGTTIRPEPVAGRTFVVFSDGGGIGERFSELARAEGHRVRLVGGGERLEDLPMAFASDPNPLELVYLRGLDPSADANGGGFTEQVTSTLEPVLRLTESLVRGSGRSSRLWLVTRDAQRVGASDDGARSFHGLSGAPLWGVGRVFALEHPELWGGLIDVVDAAHDEVASRLLREISTNDGEDQVAYRGAARFVARLARTSIGSTGDWLTLRPEGSYWITGGLGRLGLHLARFLVERGARHLVLLSRTGLPGPDASFPRGSEAERRRRAVAELEAMGAQVEVEVVDVADVEALERIARRMDEAGRPLCGVAHAAAVVDSRALESTTEEALGAVLRPKIEGAWALHRVTRSRDLDFFLLYSSSTGILGVSGLGAYAAANQFLDALARHRRTLGLPATSVSWGTWRDMRWASEEVSRRLEEGGLLPLPTEGALALLDGILQSDRSHVMAAAVDWTRLKPLYEARRRRPLLDRFAAPSDSERKPSSTRRDTFLRDLEGAAPERKRALTEAYVSEEVVRTLGLASSERLDPNRPLSEMGLDSLMAVQLKNRLESDLGLELTIRDLLSGMTLEKLVRSAPSSRSATSGNLPSTDALERRGDREGVLSYAQERFWFLDQLEPGSSLYANPAVFRIRGLLDCEALSRSLDAIRERHEILRTRFALVDGEPRQVVMDPSPFPFRVVDLRPLGGEGEREATKLTKSELLRPFDLRQGLLVRATLFRLAADDQLLVVNMHHAVSDGWSYRVFLRELGRFYHAETSAERASLPELPAQYLDFARWQRGESNRKTLERQLSYWKRQLAGSPPLLQLPTDFPRPPMQRFRGRQITAEIDPSLRRALEELSRREGATLYMTLLATFGVLLHRFTGETDVPIGSPVASRHRAEIENTIGVFLNHLVLRCDLAGDPRFRDLLDRVRRLTLDAFQNQDLPFERLLSELAPERDLSKTPLFQVFFNMANLPDYRGALPGLELDYLFSALAESKFDLTLYAAERLKTYQLVLVYNADLFEESTARQLLSGLLRLLRAVTESPEERLSGLPLLSDPIATEERRYAMPPPSLRAGEGFRSFTDSDLDGPIGARLHRIAEERGEALAVVSKTRRLSYRDLDRWTNAGVRALLEACPENGDRVALLFGHDAPMVAGVVTAVKAGRTYVPLDPGYPRERLSTMLADAGVRAVLTEERQLVLARELTSGLLPLVVLDRIPPASEAAVHETPMEALAYILYTSGSTGEPKGVMQSYRNLLHHVRCYTNNLRIGALDRLSLLASYSFDAAVMDLYGALLNGATLCLYDLRGDGLDGLGAFLDEEGVSLYHSTPTVLRHFLRSSSENSGHPSVRAVVLGGEEVHRADVALFRRSFSPQTVLVNGFGPTESTLALQFFVTTETPMDRIRVPVGLPVTATEALLLADNGAPGQVYGEIAIRSPYVALGYWNRSEQTRAAFLASENGSGARTYRTGDMGRLLADGSIEFLGRRDSRVKIRGFRIELEEVETHLERHPDVSEAVVLERAVPGGDAVLAAYVVTRNGLSVDRGELRRFLSERLPGFMVPARIETVTSIPMTPTGKVDRRALAALDPGERESLEPPRTPTEEALGAIWQRLLGTAVVSRDDNFFELGGHSLLATRLSLAVRADFAVELPLRNLFRTPTVAEMAAFIDGERAKKSNGKNPRTITRLSREAHRVPGRSGEPGAVEEWLKGRG